MEVENQMSDWKSFNGSGMDELEDLDHHVKKGIQYVKKAIDLAAMAEAEAMNGQVRFLEPTFFFCFSRLPSNTIILRVSNRSIWQRHIEIKHKSF